MNRVTAKVDKPMVGANHCRAFWTELRAQIAQGRREPASFERPSGFRDARFNGPGGGRACGWPKTLGAAVPRSKEALRSAVKMARAVNGRGAGQVVGQAAAGGKVGNSFATSSVNGPDCPPYALLQCDPARPDVQPPARRAGNTVRPRACPVLPCRAVVADVLGGETDSTLYARRVATGRTTRAVAEQDHLRHGRLADDPS